GEGLWAGLRGPAGAGSGIERAFLRGEARVESRPAGLAGRGGVRDGDGGVRGAQAAGGPRRGRAARVGRGVVDGVRRRAGALRVAGSGERAYSAGALRRAVRADVCLRGSRRLHGDGARCL
ncbi:MAG: hypothetical protein AVDCRST_MAG12-1088, partial [uncultured Rubrobacteraceae bacterium]